MPHYKDGRPAQIGDLVQDVNETHLSKSLGVLVDITPGSETCNGQLVTLARKHGSMSWIRATSEYTECVTLSDLLPLKAQEQKIAAPTPVGSGG